MVLKSWTVTRADCAEFLSVHSQLFDDWFWQRDLGTFYSERWRRCLGVFRRGGRSRRGRSSRQQLPEVGKLWIYLGVVLTEAGLGRMLLELGELEGRCPLLELGRALDGRTGICGMK